MHELSKQFQFEAAHTLARTFDAESSRRIHGHSYRGCVVVRGRVKPASGMVADLGLLELAMAHAREGLDHTFLDEVPDLGPPTLENLSAWIWRRLEDRCPGLARVTVHRDSAGDSCAYFGSLGDET